MVGSIVSATVSVKLTICEFPRPQTYTTHSLLLPPPSLLSIFFSHPPTQSLLEMRQRRESASSSGEASENSSDGAEMRSTVQVGNPKRSSFVWLALLMIIIYCCSSIYHHQFQSMPVPLTAEMAGKRGFSEIEAFKHVKALTELGPHPVGSEALHLALQYVLTACQSIKKTALWEVDVEVDLFHAKSGANHLSSGLFAGRTLVYSDLNHVVVRILPKYVSEAREQSILVSSHVDTVFSTAGAGDCSSCVGVMLELAREEEGLNGAHSFITQHPWSKTVHMAIDLEAMGIGGKSSIFQAGPHPWAIENFALVAKYPSGQIIAQDLFSSGAIKSATDFQVYKEVAGLSGLDFAYVDNTAVYHTKNDKLELLKTGSLQHLGENMLAFLLHVGASSHFPEVNSTDAEEDISDNNAIYFDILGNYMVVYRQKFANLLHNSVIMQSLLIWATSLVMGGIPAAASLVLSCFSVLLMWVFALSFSFLVAFLLPLISSSPVPYVSSPLLVVGLFGAPAFLGALTGQHLGFLLLQKYLLNTHSKRRQLPPIIKAAVVKLEAERWLYKAGSFQWLILLILGNYFKIGSSYLALFLPHLHVTTTTSSLPLLEQLLFPATKFRLKYPDGFFEATLSPARLPKPLKLATLLLGLATPILISAGIFIRLAATLIGGMGNLTISTEKLNWKHYIEPGQIQLSCDFWDKGAEIPEENRASWLKLDYQLCAILWQSVSPELLEILRPAILSEHTLEMFLLMMFNVCSTQKIVSLQQINHDMVLHIAKASVAVEELKGLLVCNSVEETTKRIDKLLMVLILLLRVPTITKGDGTTVENFAMVVSRGRERSDRGTSKLTGKERHLQNRCYDLIGWLDKTANISSSDIS
ncbi:Endoplasmic reticulum metallopeptidase 1, partial [Mucuna pruriens]